MRHLSRLFNERIEKDEEKNITNRFYTRPMTEEIKSLPDEIVIDLLSGETSEEVKSLPDEIIL